MGEKSAVVHSVRSLGFHSERPSVAARSPEVLLLWIPVVLDAVSVHVMKRSDTTG